MPDEPDHAPSLLVALYNRFLKRKDRDGNR
jgi:hypothetical protein